MIYNTILCCLKVVHDMSRDNNFYQKWIKSVPVYFALSRIRTSALEQGEDKKSGYNCSLSFPLPVRSRVPGAECRFHGGMADPGPTARTVEGLGSALGSVDE